MTQIELIKAEIERQRVDILRKVYPIHHIDVLDEILAFIDSLPEEQPSEDLEKAALLYSSPMGREDPEHLEEYPYSRADNDAFIAGAKWQKEQMMKDAPLANPK